MPVIYIAGPFRAETAWQVEQNIRRAEAVAFEVWSHGAAAICPHTNSRFFDGELEGKTWLDGYIEILKRCDGMVLVEGWRYSEGTLDELEVGFSRIPTYSAPNNEGLHLWIEGIREGLRDD